MEAFSMLFDCKIYKLLHFDLLPAIGIKSEDNHFKLLIMTITVKRNSHDYVLHTSKKIRQAIQSLQLDQVKQVICNADPTSHKTVNNYLLNKVAVMSISCKSRTHHCYTSEKW